MLSEFHKHPNATTANSQGLRVTLHKEEHEELEKELTRIPIDRAKLARELADVVYIAYGTALTYGIDLDVAVTEVHRANMTKMEAGVRRADGKIIKHPEYKAPDMTKAIGEENG